MEEVPRLLGYSVAFYTHDWMRNLCGVIYENKNRKQYFCLHCETERGEGERRRQWECELVFVYWVAKGSARHWDHYPHTHTHSHTLALVVTVIYAMLCAQCAATSSSPSPSPVWLAEHTMRRDKQWQSIRATNVAHWLRCCFIVCAPVNCFLWLC